MLLRNAAALVSRTISIRYYFMRWLFSFHWVTKKTNILMRWQLIFPKHFQFIDLLWCEHACCAFFPSFLFCCCKAFRPLALHLLRLFGNFRTDLCICVHVHVRVWFFNCIKTLAIKFCNKLVCKFEEVTHVFSTTDYVLCLLLS